MNSPAQWGNVVASGLVVGCVAIFIAVYHRFAPWRSTPIGRQVMAIAATIGAFGLYTVLITIWPQGCPAVILRAGRTALLVTISGLMLRQARMVIRAQRVKGATEAEGGPDA
jgi:hypothetical protein